MPIDRVYGLYEFAHPVVTELISAPCVQRLDGITQGGVPLEFDPRAHFSRYEHSIGVAVLLQNLGASLTEICDGVLHDVSHTAFSHVVDWVIGSSAKENFQDKQHAQFLRRTGVSSILEKHGLSLEEVIGNKQHTLLEQEIPALCADRVDYALRNFATWSNPDAVPYLVSQLTKYEGRIVFGSRKAAEIFADGFSNCQSAYWASPVQTVRYHLLAHALKLSMDSGVITFDDLYTDDTAVMGKLHAANEPAVSKVFDVLRSGVQCCQDDERPHLTVQKKFRYVDPLYLDDGAPMRLSLTDEDYAASIEKDRRKFAKPMGIRLIDAATADWYCSEVAPRHQIASQ